MKRTKPKVINAIPTEHAEQSAFMTWCSKTPGLENAFAIPNAGKRGYALANYMRSEGMRRGVPDVFIPVARGGFYGLFLEFKRRGEGVKVHQIEWHERLLSAGYQVLVVYSCDEAMEETQNYLEKGYTSRRLLEETFCKVPVLQPHSKYCPIEHD